MENGRGKLWSVIRERSVGICGVRLSGNFLVRFKEIGSIVFIFGSV